MRSRSRSKTLLALLFLIVPAQAAFGVSEEHSAQTSVIHVAVLDVQGSGPVDPKYVEGLSGVLAAEVARRPELMVTTSADIRQVLGLEAERQLLGCDAGACMAEIGGAMGVDYLISAEVSKVGTNWLLNAGLIEVRSARTVHRISRRTRDEDELIDILVAAAAEILGHLGLDDSPRSLDFTPSPKGPRRSLVSNLTLGTGALSLIGGGVLYGLAWGTWSTHKAGQEEGATPTVTWDDAQAARRNAGIGIGLLAGGAALTAASFLMPKTAPSSLGLTFVPVADGGMVVVTFSLDGTR